MKKLVILLFVFSGIINAQYQYPKAPKAATKDNYFGTEVADPYRWMENSGIPKLNLWIEQENELTFSYLSKIPFRKKLEERFNDLWNYEKFSAPSKQGEYYFFSKNDGLQEQSAVYYQKGLDAEPELFLDPNKLSDDGSVSLAGMNFSKDHQYCGYSISRGGSDWREFYVMNVENRKLLNDHLSWIKFSGMSWYKDGFYYSRYAQPKEGEQLKAKNEYQKLYYHKLGTDQSEDKLIYEDKENPKRGFGGEVTDDENFLVINIWEGSSNSNLLAFQNLADPNSKVKMVFGNSDARYWFINNVDGRFLFQTDFNTPNFKIISVDPNNPEKENWVTIIPESENVISGVSTAGGKLIVTYLEDANSKTNVYDYDGNLLHEVELPGIGTVNGFGGSKEDNEVFYTFTSFTYPPTIYKYNISDNTSTLFRKSNINFDIDKYETKEVFYKSKDGTEIPLFIVHKKGLELNGENPTLLYGYGGFNIAMKPSFRLTMLPLLENGGVYAMACLRGGSEYGEKWHKAGMLENKQNVFDDFISAGEYLINQKYTSSNKLAVFGGSNGGLLVGAVVNQRPDLMKVAIAAVGVMDMLRFHKFTIGWAWVPEYGSSEKEEHFKNIFKYSPLHNIKADVDYPAIMVTTADHDDRVFPAHSFKYAATLQEKSNGNNPALIRIETQVGHGAGTSTSKTISLYSDILSYMFYNMSLTMYD